MICKVISKYGKEIGIEGSNFVLGLEEHLDKMVASLMSLDLEVVKIARQWRLIIERIAITEGFDKIKATLEAEEVKEIVQIEKDIEINEVEMKIDIEEVLAKNSKKDMKDKGKLRDMEDIKESKENKENEEIKVITRSEKQSPKEMIIDSYIKVSLDKSIWIPN
jgi:hypothetical protein